MSFMGITDCSPGIRRQVIAALLSLVSAWSREHVLSLVSAWSREHSLSVVTIELLIIRTTGEGSVTVYYYYYYC